MTGIDAAAPPDDAAASGASPWRRFGILNALFALWLIAMLIAALFGPAFLAEQAMLPRLDFRLKPPDAANWLGTDAVGRDILARVVVAARPTLTIALGGVAVGLVIGTLIGTLAGYCGGWVNLVCMALVDIKLGFPTILFAIGVIAVFGSDTANLVIVIGVTGFVTYARVQRGVVLKIKAQPYIEAARAVGSSHARILALHVVPNALSPLLIVASIDLVRVILLEASLSFIGLGIQPPTPSWGGMINAGRDYLQTAWWICVGPGLVIMLTALGISRLGDWLRDELDPSLVT
ncbi:MAG: ABC transporter permease [Alphaproteobacteria bacterium]|nr:ABC transporter permease [Alphaproteobacteria bacterium]